MNKLRSSRTHGRDSITEVPSTTAPVEQQYTQTYDAAEHRPGSWPDGTTHAPPIRPPIVPSHSIPLDPSTEYYQHSPPSPEYGKLLSNNNTSSGLPQQPPGPSESRRMASGIQPDLDTSRTQFNKRSINNGTRLQTPQSDRMPQPLQTPQIQAQGPQPLPSPQPPPRIPQTAQAPQHPRPNRTSHSTSPSANALSGSSAPSMSSSFSSPPRSTKPSSFAPSDESSESSEPLQMSANKPAKYTMSDAGSQDWDEALGHLSLRDDRESRFLDVVDQIKDFDVNRDFSLPQLVVCGQQSCGKSSVLEALTRIPFPRGDITCTRFATECVTPSLIFSSTLNYYIGSA